jgi:hypothetical protein
MKTPTLSQTHRIAVYHFRRRPTKRAREAMPFYIVAFVLTVIWFLHDIL